MMFSEICSPSSQLGLGSAVFTSPVLWGFKLKTTKSHAQTTALIGSSKMLAQGHGVLISIQSRLLPLTQTLSSLSKAIL